MTTLCSLVSYFVSFHNINFRRLDIFTVNSILPVFSFNKTCYSIGLLENKLEVSFNFQHIMLLLKSVFIKADII